MNLTLARLCLALFILTLFSSLVRAADGDEDGKLAVFFKAFLDDEIKRKPFDATRLRNHDYDDQLDDLIGQWNASGNSPTCPVPRHPL